MHRRQPFRGVEDPASEGLAPDQRAVLPVERVQAIGSADEDVSVVGGQADGSGHLRPPPRIAVGQPDGGDR